MRKHACSFFNKGSSSNSARYRQRIFQDRTSSFRIGTKSCILWKTTGRPPSFPSVSVQNGSADRRKKLIYKQIKIFCPERRGTSDGRCRYSASTIMQRFRFAYPARIRAHWKQPETIKQYTWSRSREPRIENTWKIYWKHSKMIEIKQVTRLTSERARDWMDERMKKRTLSNVLASQIHGGR